MPTRWTGHELIEMAVEIEKNGESFHESMAGSAGDDSIKPLFAHLASEERKRLVAWPSRAAPAAGSWLADESGRFWTAGVWSQGSPLTAERTISSGGIMWPTCTTQPISLIDNTGKPLQEIEVDLAEDDLRRIFYLLIL